MKTTISVLVTSILLTGCVNGRFNSGTFNSPVCGQVSGYTYTLVSYGNGKIVVIPVSRIRAGTEWRFYLYPLDDLGGGSAYGDKTVTVDGKPAGSEVLAAGARTLGAYVLPTPPADDSWLTASGEFNTANGTGRKRYITACVDPDVQVGQDWHYTVSIEDVGSVDPRGHVER